MPKTYKISQEDLFAVKEARETNRDKQVDKRFHAIELRGEGKKNKEIAEKLETSTDMVSRWISSYAKGGLDTLLPKARLRGPTNISFEEEASLLAEFAAKAEAGQLVEVSAI